MGTALDNRRLGSLGVTGFCLFALTFGDLAAADGEAAVRVGVSAFATGVETDGMAAGEGVEIGCFLFFVGGG